MSGSWKVAYADFMTAMMAFFLLMWILNMAPKETKDGLAGYFALDANLISSVSTSSPMANNTLVQRVDKLDAREFKMNEVDQSQYAIAQTIKQFLLADAVPANASGISSDSVGVLLHVTGDTLFQPNSVTFSDEGKRILDQVIGVMRKYKVYLVLRGHASKGETGAPDYPSKWELSGARATAAARYLVDAGKIDPTLMRTVAYADTRPLVPETDPDSAVKNRRVEFYFHRPEVMSNIVGY
ncbi:MAG: flagellar motor protein MotB [Deltaproteobacteria bacterium]|jgi:chemotaxis protein MotB|nr:flagellar motor protein MotB [Deltaproteobacteria bacterium]